uniref:Vesicle associated membrane protein 1 n=1 Tax=Sus scrofa TaxID=9823 RepID=A0A4X1UR06_PIG
MSAPAQPPTEGAEGAAPGGGPPGPPPNTTSNRRLQQTQAQVEEVVDIIRVNVDKVLERDQKLSELDDRADALQAGASQFESSAAKLKRKYWWKNCKMMIMLGAICAIIVVVIVSVSGTRRARICCQGGGDAVGACCALPKAGEGGVGDWNQGSAQLLPDPRHRHIQRIIASDTADEVGTVPWGLRGTFSVGCRAAPFSASPRVFITMEMLGPPPDTCTLVMNQAAVSTVAFCLAWRK